MAKRKHSTSAPREKERRQIKKRPFKTLPEDFIDELERLQRDNDAKLANSTTSLEEIFTHADLIIGIHAKPDQPADDFHILKGAHHMLDMFGTDKPPFMQRMTCSFTAFSLQSFEQAVELRKRFGTDFEFRRTMRRYW
jgi:hypothetical protein